MSDDKQAPAGISAEDWAATPVSVRELVMSLLAVAATIEPLQQRIQAGVGPGAEQDRRLGPLVGV